MKEEKIGEKREDHVSQKVKVREINLKYILEDAFRFFSAKQKLVISSRFGIGNGEPKTLESIGKMLNVTRERVRQIEADAISVLLQSKKEKTAEELISLVCAIMKEKGGIASKEDLTGEIFFRFFGKNFFSKEEATISEIIFLMAGLRKMKANREIKDAWISPDFDKKYFSDLVFQVEEIFDADKKILTSEDLLKKIDNSEFFQKYPSASPEQILNFIGLSKKFDQNVFGDWGKARWPLIRPRGVREKATLVLMKKMKPLHFREICTLIDQYKLSLKKIDFSKDKKKKRGNEKIGEFSGKVHPQTVHNELIRDKRFVLVGRGTYALREWGYEEGTVKDVIVNILRRVGGYMKKEDLYDNILKKKKVKKATIAVNLANRLIFQKVKDGYQLKNV